MPTKGESRPLCVFLCHSSGDKNAVRDLYKRLCAEGFDPWLDEEKLLPGQDWRQEIPKAVRTSDVVIVCLSPRAVNKAGYIQKEIKYALDVADEQPEGSIFIIPLKLEECDAPEQLRRWQCANYFEESGYKRLVYALRKVQEEAGSREKGRQKAKQEEETFIRKQKEEQRLFRVTEEAGKSLEKAEKKRLLLNELVKSFKSPVAVVGLGGAGCNITTWIAEKDMAGGKIISADTDLNHLATMSKADKLILFGEKLCKGRGCGGYPEMGAQALRENLTELRSELEGTNLVFLVAGLGGGTGTGAMPVAAELTREMGALTIGCVTIPFTIEVSRREKAREAISLLASSCDSVVIIDNSRLKEVAGNLPLKESFAVANALVGTFVKNITETITQPSLINLDYADMRAVMEQGVLSTMGVGESNGKNRVDKAVSQAIATPLLDISDISTIHNILINIVGDENLSLEEIAATGELIMNKVPNTKRVIWSAKVDNQLTDKIRVMAVLIGVKSPFIEGK